MEMTDAEAQAAATITEGYHPRYSSPDASLVIASREGVKFRVHPLMLGMGSEVFSNMLTQASDTGEVVALHERTHTLKSLLDFIYPDAPYFNLEIEKFHSIWNLLIAAEKYNVERVIEELCARLTSDKYFLDNPIQTYVIACRFRRVDVARTCALNAIDSLYLEDQCVYLRYADADSIQRLYKFAEKHRNGWLKVVDTALIDQDIDLENLHPLNTNEAMEYYWEGKAALRLMKLCAKGFLQDTPSGRGISEALCSEAIEKLTHVEWESHFNRHYAEVMYAKNVLPKFVDEIVLDPRGDFID